MKKWIIGLAAAIVGYFLLRGLIAVFLSASLFQVESFHIFYGHPDQDKLQELSYQDAAIIEPTAFTKKQISFLQEKDVLLFGYVSLVQLENWNKELKKDVLPSDYRLVEGERLHVADWDTYVMDISKQHYRDVLMNKITTEIAEKQMDGVFFDTVDDLDYYFLDDPAAEKAMRAGYKQLLEEVKTAYPDLLIIQNRGFDSYKAVSRGKVDGILWEDFDKKELKKSKWAQKWRNYWKKEQSAGHVRVFTVVSDDESLQQSNRDGFPAFMRTEDSYQ
ncbi:endo alpha-1,4 polygalactosaminidase [Planomicrobium sp. CPCC 101079]|uniref:endo alpha-1,4 polygalactosaminidase n=1 Tax=Planomicrobium sp. CPCC 101079 TaxID=2599618 RepID=UPI0011B7A4A0|nr:endo alpha-1,4 polygalactosaminidase [Planomicrobium sp. CPCC 101079]TWT00164.1 endo alpha-1,4 polygalactosaminidase [Planomicrobium sp. CPCC 101079]